MYDYFHGQLAYADLKTAVIDCGGVGYKCNITETTYKHIYAADDVKLYTYLAVREDAMELYGFASEEERACFLQLISISGVGPKAGLAVLSALSCEQLAAAVEQGDYKAIARANGVGPKIAQRICLELKGKLTVTADGEVMENAVSSLAAANEKEDAIEILASLGYTRSDSKKAVDRCSADNAQDIVKQALRILSVR